MNRLSLPTLFLIAGIALAWGGCNGYRLGDVKPSSYAGIDRIHIPVFRNETLHPRLSSLVTNAVLKEIQADGTYTVSNRANSDAVLVGTIHNVDQYQLRAVRTDTLQSQELLLYLFVDFHLEDPNTGEKISSTAPRGAPFGKTKEVEDDEVVMGFQGRVYGETIQFVDRSFQVGERNALSMAAEDLAEKLVSQLSNGW